MLFLKFFITIINNMDLFRFGCQHNQTVATELLEKIMERYKKYDRKLIGRELFVCVMQWLCECLLP